MKPINTTAEGTKLFRVLLGTGFFWLVEFKVYAESEAEAINAVADYVEVYNPDLCGTTKRRGLTCAGKHGIYIRVKGVEELK